MNICWYLTNCKFKKAFALEIWLWGKAQSGPKYSRNWSNFLFLAGLIISEVSDRFLLLLLLSFFLLLLYLPHLSMFVIILIDGKVVLDLTRMFFAGIDLWLPWREKKKDQNCLWNWNSSLTLAWLHHKILIHRACLCPSSRVWISPVFQSACFPPTLRRLSLVLWIDWEGGWPLTSHGAPVKSN